MFHGQWPQREDEARHVFPFFHTYIMTVPLISLSCISRGCTCHLCPGGSTYLGSLWTNPSQHKPGVSSGLWGGSWRVAIHLPFVDSFFKPLMVIDRIFLCGCVQKLRSPLPRYFSKSVHTGNNPPHGPSYFSGSFTTQRSLRVRLDQGSSAQSAAISAASVARGVWLHGGLLPAIFATENG